MIRINDRLELWMFSVILPDAAFPVPIRMMGLYDNSENKATVFFRDGTSLELPDNEKNGFMDVVSKNMKQIGKKAVAGMLVAAVSFGSPAKSEELVANQRIVNVGFFNQLQNQKPAANEAIMVGVQKALQDNVATTKTKSGEGKVNDTDIIINVYDNDTFSKKDVDAIRKHLSEKFGTNMNEEISGYITAHSITSNIYPVAYKRETGDKPGANIVYVGIGKNLYDAIEKDPNAGAALIEGMSSHEISHARNDFSEAGAALAQRNAGVIDIHSPVARVAAADIASGALYVQKSALWNIHNIDHTKDNFSKIHLASVTLMEKEAQMISDDLSDIAVRGDPEKIGKYLPLFGGNRSEAARRAWVVPNEYADVIRNSGKRLDDGATHFSSAGGYLVNLAKGLNDLGFSKREVVKYMEQLVFVDGLTIKTDKEFGVFSLGHEISEKESRDYSYMINGVIGAIEHRMDSHWDLKNEKEGGLLYSISQKVGMEREGYAPGAPSL